MKGIDLALKSSGYPSIDDLKTGRRAGVRLVKNMCPSQGTMDIFIEPVLPRPQIVICGASPVAVAIADFGRRIGFDITVCASAADQAAFSEVERRIEGYALPVTEAPSRFVVVSTQGRGDEAALMAALAVDADYVAFVGSRKNAEALKAEFAASGIAPERLARTFLSRIDDLTARISSKARRMSGPGSAAAPR
jgi:xanthine dehydrogenase accessory factor